MVCYVSLNEIHYTLHAFTIEQYVILYYYVSSPIYFCSELNSKLQDTLEMIEEQLDSALSKTCNHFDEKHYAKVQLAYQLLGKTQVCFWHFISSYSDKQKE